MKDGRWLLVVRQKRSDAFEALNKATCLIILITLLGGAAIVSVAFYLSSRVVGRMVKIDSEKEDLGRDLIRAGRLAELGEMATGFAHEINNPLQIMKSEYALIHTILPEIKEKAEETKIDTLEELTDSLEQINSQVDRCSEITRAILRFGRKSEPSTEKIRLESAMREISSMVEKKAKVNGIDIRIDIQESLPSVKGDPSLLQQVFLNLLNNAMDAIEARYGSTGGTINISAGRCEGYVRISIQDNGCGMDEVLKQKIFTPFFTTKPVGKGTGLGLSVCYGIVENMGGGLEIESTPGRGTTIEVLLPADGGDQKAPGD
jgi:two-component system NtrC family sensor kinase